MSTLAVVEQILRETEEPMSVRQIVEYAGDRLPTKSRTPDTVVARDLSMDIKKKGEASSFIRTSPGRYAIRATPQSQLDRQPDRQPAQKQPQTPKPPQSKPRTAHVRAATPMAAASMGATSMAVEHARPLAARATTESEISARSSATNA